jgi:hypothetical protein
VFTQGDAALEAADMAAASLPGDEIGKEYQPTDE